MPCLVSKASSSGPPLKTAMISQKEDSDEGKVYFVKSIDHRSCQPAILCLCSERRVCGIISHKNVKCHVFCSEAEAQTDIDELDCQNFNICLYYMTDLSSNLSKTKKRYGKQVRALSTSEYFKYFGLDRKTATIKDLKKAYKQLCRELHPDKGGNLEEFLEMKRKYNALLKTMQDGMMGSDHESSSDSESDSESVNSDDSEEDKGKSMWDINDRESMVDADKIMRARLRGLFDDIAILEAKLKKLHQENNIKPLREVSELDIEECETCISDQLS